MGRLISEEDRIDVVTTYPNRYRDYCPKPESEDWGGKIRVHRVKVPVHSSGMAGQALAYLWYFFYVLAIVAFKRFDRIFATSSRLFTASLGAFLSMIKGIPLFLDIRDLFVENMEELTAGKNARGMMGCLSALEKFTLKRASWVNAVSEGFDPYLKRLYSGKIYHYTNGIDDEFLNREWKDTRLRKKTIVTYAGNIGEGQGLHRLFPALSRAYPDIEFRIIGNGGMKRTLEERIRGEENVILIPPVGREVLVRYYDESDALLLHLNDYRCFERVLPSKIFEYGATGKTIVAGVSGFARIFLEENIPDLICFDPGNVQQLTTAYHGEKRGLHDREEFKLKFARRVVMAQMAKQLLAPALEKAK